MEVFLFSPPPHNLIQPPFAAIPSLLAPPPQYTHTHTYAHTRTLHLTLESNKSGGGGDRLETSEPPGIGLIHPPITAHL